MLFRPEKVDKEIVWRIKKNSHHNCGYTFTKHSGHGVNEWQYSSNVVWQHPGPTAHARRLFHKAVSLEYFPWKYDVKTYVIVMNAIDVALLQVHGGPAVSNFPFITLAKSFFSTGHYELTNCWWIVHKKYIAIVERILFKNPRQIWHKQ